MLAEPRHRDLSGAGANLGGAAFALPGPAGKWGDRHLYKAGRGYNGGVYYAERHYSAGCAGVGLYYAIRGVDANHRRLERQETVG